MRALSILQRLNHPNILKLLACYTHKNKHNIISPYIRGGTLQAFLGQQKTSDLTQSEVFYMISGLASAVWALHEIFGEDTKAILKGLHQDLRPANVLADGKRLILADFGLSSIRAMGEHSTTPFKGRVDYYQAPECADLRPPYEEHKVTRAADIFSLGCIIIDMIVYYMKGRAGLEAFHESRNFASPPFHFHLYHNGTILNEVVTRILNEISEPSKSTSLRRLAELVAHMLEINPEKRPSGRTVTVRLYTTAIVSFAEHLEGLFTSVVCVPEAVIEQARFVSWRRSFETLFSLPLPATTMAGMFESMIAALNQLEQALQDIDSNTANLDPRTFFRVRQANTELLNMLPEDGKAKTRAQLDTILLKNILPSMSASVQENLRSAFAEAHLINKIDIKGMIVQLEHSREASAQKKWDLVPGPLNLRLSYVRQRGRHKIAKVYGGSHTKVVLEETIQYQDQLRRSKLEPRVHALCDLLSSGNLPRELRVPPLIGLHDDQFSFSFGLLYDLTRAEEMTLEDYKPTDLHEVLTNRNCSQRPSLERRLRLASSLAESLAAFHDVDWYHKDLTSHSVLFLPYGETTMQWINEPYLIGFQYSRSASEDFSEGPLQDRNHCRYHEPQYLSMETRQFKDFRPEYDYYSLGILLLEIALWDTIDMFMRNYADMDNHAFSQAVLETQLSPLCYVMGSKYAAVVEQCLRGFSNQPSIMEKEGITYSAQGNLLFKETVVLPLKSLSSVFNDLEEPDIQAGAIPQRKRKKASDTDVTVVLSPKKMKR